MEVGVIERNPEDPPQRPSAPSPRADLDADREAADRLESALGHEVKVKPRGEEIAVEIRLQDLDEALALARSLSRRRR